SVANLLQAHAKFVFPHGPYTFDGDLDVPVVALDVQSHVHGELSGSHFTAGGTGSFTDFGATVAGGQLVASDKGIGGCGTVSSGLLLGPVNPLSYFVGDVQVGFKIVSNHLSAFTGCDLSDLTTVAHASAD